MAGNIKQLVEVIVNSVPRLHADVYGNAWPSHPHHQHTELDHDDHEQYMLCSAGPDRIFTGDVYWDDDLKLVGKTDMRLDDHWRDLHTTGAGDWTQDHIKLSANPGEWQDLYDAAGGIVSIIGALKIAIESGSDYWARDAVNGLLYPIATTDTLRVGQGSVSYPSIAFKDHNNYGLMFEPSLDALAWTTAGQQRLRIYHEDDPWYRVNIEVPDSWDNNKLRINHDKATTASRFYYSGVSSVLSYYETIVKSPTTTSSYWYTECTGTSSGGATNWWESKASGNRSAYAYYVATSDNTAMSALYAQGSAGTQVAGMYAIQGGNGSSETSSWVDASTGHHNYWSEGQQIMVMQHTTAMTGSAANLITLGTDVLDWLFWSSHSGSGRLWILNEVDDDSRVYLESESASTGYSELYVTSTASAEHAGAYHFVDSTSDYAEYYVNVQSLGGDGDLQLRVITGASGGDATLNIFAEAAGATSLATISIVADDTVAVNGGILFLIADDDVLYFADGFIGPSDYASSYIELAESVAEWDDFYANFGTVSLIDAINQAAGMTAPAALTAGYVGYGSATNELTGESAFFYDAANNYLGIGHATPDCGLHLGANNPTYSSGGSDAFITGDLEVTNIDLINTIRMRGFTAGSIPYLAGSPVSFVENNSYLRYTGTEFTARANSATGTQANAYLSAYNTSTGFALVGITASGVLDEAQAYIRSIDSVGTAMIDLNVGFIHLDADATIEFVDGNWTGSSWTALRVPLSDSTDGWDDYETAHGEVGLMEAIAHAGFVGSEVASGSSDSQSSTTSSSYQQKLRVTTPSLTSGVGYLVLWSCELQADADVETQMHIDFNDSGPPYIAEGYYDNDPYANRGTTQSGIYYSTSLSGVYNIDMDYRRAYAPGGVGSAYISRARIVVIRVT